MFILMIPTRKNLLDYTPTPLQELRDHPLLKDAGVHITIKREDLNHPTVSGNKWWKLKLNLEHAAKTHKSTLLTFGGAYSNHIYATAAATFATGLKSIGIIRGDEIRPLNPTLKFAEQRGMQLYFISRTDYRNKTSSDSIDELKKQFGDFHLIPEGGSNLLAVKGCAIFARRELAPLEFDHVYLPVGTGGTVAGIICGLRGKKQITGVSVLKDGSFLEGDIKALVHQLSGESFSNWSLLTGYHHGGYAKTTPALMSFIRQMKTEYDLPLDYVYTGKLLWALFKEIEAGAFQPGTRILMIHTGGLQGNIIST